jgi:16S rRNA (cytosine967-C5)-methyltransferase
MEFDARLANRMKHAEVLWERYTDSPAPRQLDKWIAETLKADKRYGSQDRRFYSDILFSAARYVTLAVFLQRSAGNISSFFEKSSSEREQEIAKFTAEVTDEKLLWTAVRATAAKLVVSLARDALMQPDFMQAEFQKFISNRRSVADWTDAELQTVLILHGIPPAWSAPLQRRITVSGWSTEELLRFLRMQNERPPLWIRLNRAEAAAAIEQEFDSRGLKIEWLDDKETAKVTGSFGVYQTEVFKSGAFEVQDWASQQIARSVGAQAGQKIWDACAGGGGKTVAIAACMKGKGALYASDIREFKLAEARRRCQRAGFFNLRTAAWDGKEFPEFGKEVHLQGGFDTVLVDAPCSSSGTWRRNPDARLRIGDNESLGELVNLQKSLLLKAALKVRSGGRLVYGTCSWCVEENEDVIAAAQSALTQLTAIKISASLAGAPFVDSDTMFAAQLLLNPTLASGTNCG